MDNEAFRSLVNKQVKSTKEIAREAVETEFREKAQKRGGGGGGRRGRRSEYDSDSASEDESDHLTKRRREDEGNNSKEPEWKRRRKEKAAAATATTIYRDRAKERREGKNVDYNDTSTTNIYNNGDNQYSDKKRQAELSKFLGGDEQHTHLVKGLDVALASKIRREEMGNKQTGAEREEEEDLDQLLEDAYNTQQNETTTSSVSTNSKKSSSIAMIQPKSDLGKSVQQYLLKHYQQQPSLAAATQQQSIQINPTKQNSIQRSHYTFSLDPNIQKRGKAWDVPQLKMIGGGQQQQQQQVTMTPLDCHLIATIRNKLDGTLKSKKTNDDDGRDGTDHNDNGVKQHQLQQLDDEGDNTKEKSSGDNTIDHKTARGSSSPPANNEKDDDSNDDDSDDDIFADVGAYIPPTAVAAATVEDSATAQTKNDDVASTSCTTTTKKKSSIFDNLVTDESRKNGNNLHKRQPMQLPQTQQQQHLIDRDVFGGNRKKQQEQQQSLSLKRRGPQTAAMEGVSMTNYQGGYGEEMDTDFLNEDEDVDRKMKRRDDNHGDDDEGSKGENLDADEED